MSYFCSWSGGKDCCLSLFRYLQTGHRVDLLLTMMCEDGERSRSHGLSKEQSLVNLSIVNKSWNQRLSKLISYSEPEIEKFIDLRVSTSIQKCLSTSFKEASFVSKAVELARQFYEAKPMGIKIHKYGAAFPITPELLYYAMFLAKNETVLEIAGASGENSALLAFSGAKRVYMNDIVPDEVESFENLCNQLPSQVQKKIEPVLGNCFELLQLKPELKGTVGLLLCNNLLHFFNDEEQAKLA